MVIAHVIKNVYFCMRESTHFFIITNNKHFCMKKLSTLRTMLAALLVAVGMGTAWADELPTPVYFNDFSSTEGLTIVGNGVFEDDADARFGKVFHNDPTLTKAIRTNYLLLPNDVLSHSATTKEMTIGFWVNMKDAQDFFWSPMFAAYDNADRAANANEPWPHFVLMARKEVTLNCWGYCDLGNTVNDNGVNAQTSAWLDDKAWHYYTATLTATSVKVYIDGILENSWTLDGTTPGQIVEGVFNAGAEYATNDFGLKYICLGGNQACNWGDPDPAFAFDDFAVYDKALTADQIKQVMEAKMSYNVMLDFENNNQNLPYSTGGASDPVAEQNAGNLGGKTITIDGVQFSFVNSPTMCTKYHYDANGTNALNARGKYFQMIKGGQMRITAPEGKAVTAISFAYNPSTNKNTGTTTYQTNLTLEKGEGTLSNDKKTWTGNAKSVRFGATGSVFINSITVTYSDADENTVTPEADTYTEVDGLAAFKEVADGALVKLTLTNAIITAGMNNELGYYVQDATAGAHFYCTNLDFNLNDVLNGYVYVKKSKQTMGSRIAMTEETNADNLEVKAGGSYEPVTGAVDDVNKAENQLKVVKLTGVAVKGTSETEATITDASEKTIDINNGKTNYYPYSYTESLAGMDLAKATVVGILYGSSATVNKIIPLSITEEISADATFDFQNNPKNWPYGTEVWGDEAEKGKVSELTENDIKLTSIQNNAYNANMIYKAENADPVFRVAKENAFKLTAPEGKAIVKVSVTMATGSFDFTADNGTIAENENVWTGNATEVTFTTASNRSISKIDVTLADENEDTVKPAVTVEVDNIAAFNAVEDGTTVKLTLANARVNGVMGGSYYVEDATGATVIKGIELTAGKALNGYIVGTKSTDTSVDMNGEIKEYALTATDASTFEATATTLEGTTMTVDAVGAQANYGKLITVENVTISGSGLNKSLTDANNNTIKARDYMGVLPTDYTWPEKASKITGVVIYYMTGWFLMPISADAIVEDTTQGIETINATTTESMTIYNLQGQRLNGLQKGINIVNGKKVVIK